MSITSYQIIHPIPVCCFLLMSQKIVKEREINENLDVCKKQKFSNLTL